MYGTTEASSTQQGTLALDGGIQITRQIDRTFFCSLHPGPRQFRTNYASLQAALRGRLFGCCVHSWQRFLFGVARRKCRASEAKIRTVRWYSGVTQHPGAGTGRRQ